MNDRSRLYMALRVARPTLGSGETVEFHFDNAHHGRGGDLGEDIVRLSRQSGAVDMYFDGQQTIFPDTRDGGSADLEGSVQNDGSVSVFELAHPLNTPDDAHDFSLRPGSLVGLGISFDDCHCPQNLRSGWPAPGPWADIAIVAEPRHGVIQRAWMSLAGRTQPISRVRSARGIQASFLFRIPPAEGARVRVVWFRDSSRVGSVGKDRTKLVTSALFAGSGLASGVYRAVLQVAPARSSFRPVATARLRIG
jgi:hypothetical protein